MAIATRCQTPGTVFHTEIKGDRIVVTIDLPLDLPAGLADLVEANIHNALELALAGLFCQEVQPWIARL